MPIVGAAATALGASAATASLATAVATKAVVGAVIGAAIGGGAAALTGGDIGKGALMGALGGAVSGGVAGYVQGTSAGAGASGAAAGPALDGSGAAIDAAMGEHGYAYSAADLPPISETAPKTGLLSSAGGAAPQAAPPAAGTVPAAGSSMSPEKAQIYAGIGKGLFEGVGKVGAAMIEGKSEEKRFERELEAERERIARNQPGTWERRVLNISVPQRWENAFASLTKYSAPLYENKGLLNTEVAA